jgi:hypothetical protein
MEHRFRQRSRVRRLVAQLHIDRVAAPCAFRLQPLLEPSRTDQQASLGPGLFDRGAHERIDQLFEDELARDRLRRLDRRIEIELFGWPRNCAQLSDSTPGLQSRACRECWGEIHPKIWTELSFLARRDRSSQTSGAGLKPAYFS